ncbi:hypothetical protein CesoFtcFv8_021534 [Champsocephalus esox]|uniref:Uncharacterized protein n=1 Tax=Champsocephalus esox TaxID=159716 RepID=A0AAN8B8P1_9TELE|nr:hypothetical protein CesoFtcFv8_021533 [Champsocephalus esox]KAK5880648.1 hypothetical protein CesoFtcFv8_021534 [Champsocephalus esox]
MVLTLRDRTTDKVRHLYLYLYLYLYLSAMVLTLRDGTTDKVRHLYPSVCHGSDSEGRDYRQGETPVPICLPWF